MKKDDLFRKRKEQKAADLARETLNRARGLRYLIVCEGGKTEPNYFRLVTQLQKLADSAPGK